MYWPLLIPVVAGAALLVGYFWTNALDERRARQKQRIEPRLTTPYRSGIAPTGGGRAQPSRSNEYDGGTVMPVIMTDTSPVYVPSSHCAPAASYSSSDSSSCSSDSGSSGGDGGGGGGGGE